MFNRIPKHLINQPFVLATGVAALIHSTWSLGTLFSGTEPAFGLAWLAWLIPAFLIAFSLDVGQIVTSAEIRSGERNRAKYLTFFTFAAGTYYLQWLYISSHMPAVDLAPGVRETWANAAAFLRDSAVWIIPGLLPLSTMLYTMSYSRPPAAPGTERTQERAIIPVNTDTDVMQAEVLPESFVAHCACGWTKPGYANARNRDNALRAHTAHCEIARSR